MNLSIDMSNVYMEKNNINTCTLMFKSNYNLRGKDSCNTQMKWFSVFMRVYLVSFKILYEKLTMRTVMSYYYYIILDLKNNNCRFLKYYKYFDVLHNRCVQPKNVYTCT